MSITEQDSSEPKGSSTMSRSSTGRRVSYQEKLLFRWLPNKASGLFVSSLIALLISRLVLSNDFNLISKMDAALRSYIVTYYSSKIGFGHVELGSVPSHWYEHEIAELIENLCRGAPSTLVLPPGLGEPERLRDPKSPNDPQRPGESIENVIKSCSSEVVVGYRAYRNLFKNETLSYKTIPEIIKPIKNGKIGTGTQDLGSTRNPFHTLLNLNDETDYGFILDGDTLATPAVAKKECFRRSDETSPDSECYYPSLGLAAMMSFCDVEATIGKMGRAITFEKKSILNDDSLCRESLPLTASGNFRKNRQPIEAPYNIYRLNTFDTSDYIENENGRVAGKLPYLSNKALFLVLRDPGRTVANSVPGTDKTDPIGTGKTDPEIETWQEFEAQAAFAASLINKHIQLESRSSEIVTSAITACVFAILATFTLMYTRRSSTFMATFILSLMAGWTCACYLYYLGFDFYLPVAGPLFSTVLSSSVLLPGLRRFGKRPKEKDLPSDVENNPLSRPVVDTACVNERRSVPKPDEWSTPEPATPDDHQPIRLFCTSDRKDEMLREKLGAQLSQLTREGVLDEWHLGLLEPGLARRSEIDRKLEAAEIILLLVSPSYLKSEECRRIEEIAMNRHKSDLSRVIPVILRSCDWESAAFGRLQTLPPYGTPVTDESWSNSDQALVKVAQGIRKIAHNMQTARIRN